jgi:putative thioredoxin
VVVDFWAEWCGPCRTLGPTLERAVAERDGEVELVKVDVDANPELSRRFGIRGIPAVKGFRDGQEVAEFVGAQPAAAVERFLDDVIPSDEEALQSALEQDPHYTGGLEARTELEAFGAVPEALEALRNGDHETGLERLAAALEEADPDTRELIRRVMVGVFAELGTGDPLSSKYRRRLSAALY